MQPITNYFNYNTNYSIASGPHRHELSLQVNYLHSSVMHNSL